MSILPSPAPAGEHYRFNDKPMTTRAAARSGLLFAFEKTNALLPDNPANESANPDVDQKSLKAVRSNPTIVSYLDALWDAIEAEERERRLLPATTSRSTTRNIRFFELAHSHGLGDDAELFTEDGASRGLSGEWKPVLEGLPEDDENPGRDQPSTQDGANDKAEDESATLEKLLRHQDLQNKQSGEKKSAKSVTSAHRATWIKFFMRVSRILEPDINVFDRYNAAGRAWETEVLHACEKQFEKERLKRPGEFKDVTVAPAIYTTYLPKVHVESSVFRLSLVWCGIVKNVGEIESLEHVDHLRLARFVKILLARLTHSIRDSEERSETARHSRKTSFQLRVKNTQQRGHRAKPSHGVLGSRAQIEAQTRKSHPRPWPEFDEHGQHLNNQLSSTGVLEKPPVRLCGLMTVLASPLEDPRVKKMGSEAASTSHFTPPTATRNKKVLPRLAFLEGAQRAARGVRITQSSNGRSAQLGTHTLSKVDSNNSPLRGKAPLPVHPGVDFPSAGSKFNTGERQASKARQLRAQQLSNKKRAEQAMQQAQRLVRAETGGTPDIGLETVGRGIKAAPRHHSKHHHHHHSKHHSKHHHHHSRQRSGARDMSESNTGSELSESSGIDKQTPLTREELVRQAKRRQEKEQRRLRRARRRALRQQREKDIELGRVPRDEFK